MTRTEQRKYRAGLKRKGLKVHSFIVPTELIPAVKEYIKEQARMQKQIEDLIAERDHLARTLDAILNTL